LFLKERIITGTLSGLFFLGMLIIGDIYFGVLIVVLAVIAYYELLKMSGIRVASLPFLCGFLFLGAILAETLSELNALAVWTVEMNWQSFFLVLILLLLASIVITKNRYTIEHVGLITVGVLYIGFGFAAVIHIRFEEGLYFILFVLLAVFAADTGAYFLGRSFGKHKLWPLISPKKTIEGFLGGVLSSVGVAVLFQLFAEVLPDMLTTITLAAVISVSGQFGDLVESAIKRHYEVKDSGTILPGHGGVLDRFDSLLFVFLLLHIFYI
jgi:phosphatidate cytidylyltransferase